MAALYAAADAFVLPSLKEPYGTVYGEAMAYGLPVVGWRAGNLPYLADDEREGLLVEPGDMRGLTAALQRLADDAEPAGASRRRRQAAEPSAVRPGTKSPACSSITCASVLAAAQARSPV